MTNLESIHSHSAVATIREPPRMNDALRVNVITSCTGRKVALAPGDTAPAERLYCGQHHVRLMRGVDYLRGAGATVDRVDRVGRPWTRARQPTAWPHMSRPFKAGERSSATRWPANSASRERSERSWRPGPDLTVVLLGEDYLQACQPRRCPVEQGAPTLVFALSVGLPAMSAIAGLHVVALGVEHTRQFAAGLVALKGEVGGRLLAALADGAVSIDDVLAENPLPASPPSAVDPRPPMRLPRCSEMRFYFPDSQDQIDPSFDFETEERSPFRIRQRDDLYAHEVLDPVPYTGMLISKAMVDGVAGGAGRYSAQQRQRLYRVGIREFFRLDDAPGPRIDTIGDCGAFTYVREDVPPYSVDDVIDFYDGIGVDAGLSLDHVIFGFELQPAALG